jgi:hypothetical protein
VGVYSQQESYGQACVFHDSEAGMCLVKGAVIERGISMFLNRLNQPPSMLQAANSPCFTGL